MKTHTPGPWHYDADSGEVFSSDDRHGCGWIALVRGSDSNGAQLDEAQRDANVRLIANAPNLLSELKTVVDYLEQLTMYERIDFGSSDGDLVAVNDRILMNAVAAIRRAEKGDG